MDWNIKNKDRHTSATIYGRVCQSFIKHIIQKIQYIMNFDVANVFSICVVVVYPMDTSSSIRHWFDVETPRGKFVEISSISKRKCTRKLWHQFDVEISTWIQHSKLVKYRWVLHMDFSMSFQCRINVTALLAISFLSFSKISCSENQF